jgi:hypothetical protein
VRNVSVDFKSSKAVALHKKLLDIVIGVAEGVIIDHEILLWFLKKLRTRRRDGMLGLARYCRLGLGCESEFGQTSPMGG